MAEIGSLVVDLTLKFAEFSKDLEKVGRDVGKSAKNMQGSLQQIQGTFDAVGKAIAGLLTLRFIRAIDRMVEQSLRLAATIKGPLGIAARDFLDKAESFSNAFRLGVATGFMDALQRGLQDANVSLNDLAAAGIFVGNVLGQVFASIVNFFTHDIPEGIRTSADSLNVLIGDFNNLIATFNAANETLNNSALGQLLGFSGTQGNIAAIPFLDTSAIQSAITSYQGLAISAGISAGAIQLTTEGQRQMNLAAQRFAETVQANESIYAQLRTPVEEYGDALDRINTAHLQGELAARAHAAATANLAGSYLGLASTVGGALSTVFKDSKGVAIAEAVINTAQAITKTIAQYGFTPWGIAAAAAAAAAGAAQIATIVRTNPGGNARPSVSGGKSAAITSGSARSSGAVPSSSVFINVQGSSRFTTAEVENMISQIIDAQRDGAQLVLSK